jgi:hypothetical protein
VIVWFGSFEVVGTYVVAAAAVPYVVEILAQLPLLARVMRALPEETRAALPPHPRHPWLAMFGSMRFFFALLRFARRDQPADSAELRALKRRIRATLFREAVFGVLFWGTVIALWVRGWRPWP